MRLRSAATMPAAPSTSAASPSPIHVGSVPPSPLELSLDGGGGPSAVALSPGDVPFEAFVTARATATSGGAASPSPWCQANASDPPAGTSSEVTPRVE